MKNYIVKLLVVVMLLSFFSTLSVFANDSNAMMSAYLDVLNSLKDDGDWDARYIVYDIDKNGVSELIIESGVASESILYFYTFDNGFVKYLGEKRGSHASLASVPNENGVMRISAHSDIQHVSVISVIENSIEETEVLFKRFTPEEYDKIGGYYEPQYFYKGSVYLELIDKDDLSGFGDFNYIESGSVSTASYETGMKKGIGYYNDGLYYEAIDEIQWFCDGNWYNMTEEQQNNALSYLGSAKTNLADYLFESGKNYYNSGLYYEARIAFNDSMLYYEQVKSSKWQEANDYLYNTNEKIKQWENRPIYDKYGIRYETYDGSFIPKFEPFAGKRYNETDMEFDLNGNFSGWKYKYYFWGDTKKLIDSVNNYMDLLETNGFVLTGSGDYVKYYYYRRGNNKLMIFIDIDDSYVSINVFN